MALDVDTALLVFCVQALGKIPNVPEIYLHYLCGGRERERVRERERTELTSSCWNKQIRAGTRKL